MVRGFYTAGSGLLSQQKIMNAIGQNMTNANTAGYKKERLITNTFEQELLIRLEKDNTDNLGANNAIGSAIIRYSDELYTNFEQGSVEQTNRAYDMALLGDGFFVVQDGEQQLLTRNGQFRLDDEGFLTLSPGGRVLGKNGEPIKLPNSGFVVDANGSITDGKSKKGSLMLVRPTDYSTLSKYGEGLFINDAANDPNSIEDATGSVAVMQGAYERSNVEIGEEMTDILASSRAFQSCAQMVKMIDQINTKAVAELGKL